jgi:outer membrane protein, multidrug efflux system
MKLKPLPVLVAAVAAVLSGCSMAPRHERPAAPVAESYPATPAVAGYAPAAAAQGKAAYDTGWREYFTDPRLQQLIASALEHNRDLRTAALRVEEARALYNVQAADRLPNVNAGASESRSRTPAALSPTGKAAVGQRADVSVAIPAFELDFFGRVKSLSDAALASYLATDEARTAAQLTVVAETAKAYYTERALAEQATLAQRTYDARARTYGLTRQRLEAGASSLLDVRSNETLMETARVAALTVARQRAQAANALAVLVGEPVLSGEPGGMLSAQLSDEAIDAMSALPEGLPSDLIARRPDIRASEQRLQAANANIGAARAAFFPRVSLTAALGSASPSFGGLFDGGSGTWSFTPQLVLPVFAAGRNQANLSLAETRKHIAVADYEKTIQVAFREVADALAARSYLGGQVTAQRAIQEAQADRLRLLTLRFENGVASSLDVLDAQRELFSAEQSLVQARLLRATSAIDLYKALGGGVK